MSTRRYEQRLRAESADQTRRRILDNVYDRLREAPSQPVSVDQVARASGVSRSTVYLIFGTRAGLFDALAADLRERTGFDAMARDSEHPDAVERLDRGLRGSAESFARHRDVIRVLFSMAQLDAEAVGGTIHRMEDSRRAETIVLAQRLSDQDALRDDVTVDDAVDTLWLLGGFEAFDHLFTGRGLTAARVAEVLTGTAHRSLLRVS